MMGYFFVASLTTRAAAWLKSSRGFLLAGLGFLAGAVFFAIFFIATVYAGLRTPQALWKTKLHHYPFLFLVDTALIEN
jgi:uncharacterized membrane protein YhiD involved in acid resistance